MDETCSFSNLCCIYDGDYGDITGTVVETNEIFVHENYNKGLDWDFCLAKVDKINIDGTTVKPVKFPDAHVLPSIVTEGETSTATKCWVMGWGETESGFQSATLLAARVEIMSDRYCKALGGRYSRVDSAFEFCAGKRPNLSIFLNEDSCSGDSGAPLVCEHGENFIQYGIVSRGGKRCGVKYEPGVYSKVASVRPWIKEITGMENLKFVQLLYETSI